MFYARAVVAVPSRRTDEASGWRSENYLGLEYELCCSSVRHLFVSRIDFRPDPGSNSLAFRLQLTVSLKSLLTPVSQVVHLSCHLPIKRTLLNGEVL